MSQFEVDRNKFSMLYSHWGQFNDIIQEFCEEYVDKMRPDDSVCDEFDWEIETDRWNGDEQLPDRVIAKFWGTNPSFNRSFEHTISFPLHYVRDPDWEDIERKRLIDEHNAAFFKHKEDEKQQKAEELSRRKQLYEELKQEFG